MQRASMVLASPCVVAALASATLAHAQELVYAGEPTPSTHTETTLAAPDPPIDAFVQKAGYDFELAARVGYATAPIRGGTNPFGAGFGGRLGFAIGHLYVGATIIDYLGGTDVDLSDSALLYGLEVGYGFRYRVFTYGALTIRPQLGFGNAMFSHTDPRQAKVDVVTSASGSRSSSSSDTTTVNNVYVEPALLVMLASGRHFAAIGASVIVVPGISYGEPESSTWLSYSLQGHVGFRF